MPYRRLPVVASIALLLIPAAFAGATPATGEQGPAPIYAVASIDPSTGSIDVRHHEGPLGALGSDGGSCGYLYDARSTTSCGPDAYPRADHNQSLLLAWQVSPDPYDGVLETRLATEGGLLEPAEGWGLRCEVDEGARVGCSGFGSPVWGEPLEHRCWSHERGEPLAGMEALRQEGGSGLWSCDAWVDEEPGWSAWQRSP